MKLKCAGVPLALMLGLLPVAALGQLPTGIYGPIPIPDGYVGTSPPLTELAAAAAPQVQAPDGERVMVQNMLLKPRGLDSPFRPQGAAPSIVDPVRQGFGHPIDPAGSETPEPSMSFEGTSSDDNSAVLGYRIVPPDTEGDVGLYYYVQSNNGVFAIYDKTDGSSVIGPLANNIFFQDSGAFCGDWNDGDPIVLYDHMADRWVFTQFALFDLDPAAGVYVSYECFAVAATSDPLGPYHLYQFEVARPLFGWFSIADYPKVGVWPDGYYMSSNDFESVGFVSAAAYAFDRQAMLNGLPATGVKFIDFTAEGDCADPATRWAFSLQPSDLDGSPPPEGTPNTFVQAYDEWLWGCGPGTNDGYRMWDLVVDWSDPASATFTDLGTVPSPDFDGFLCIEPQTGNFGQCVPQPDVAQTLDSLSQFTMTPARYRFFRGKGKGLSRSNRLQMGGQGGYGVMMVNSTVNVGGGIAGVRWAELRRVPDREDPEKVAGWKLHQVGTYAPDDGENRWMGSAAMNGRGAIAVSYSVSSDSTYPSIRYNTQARGGPKGMLTGGEVSCMEGSGSQIGIPQYPDPPYDEGCDPATEQCRGGERWGDYSTISVDPTDDCTFWLTNEYYETTGAFDWKTQICSFSMCD